MGINTVLKRLCRIISAVLGGQRIRNGMVEDKYGTRVWWLDGKRHRADGPAVEWSDGSRVWYRNGKWHRTDGPAVEWATGTREWWVDGKLHRTDGPAIEYSSGTRLWWLNDQEYTFDEWLKVNTTLDSGKRIVLLLVYGEQTVVD